MSSAVAESTSPTGPGGGSGQVSGGGLPGLGLVLRRSWWVAIACVLGLFVGLALGQVRPDQYSSTAFLSVATGGPPDVYGLTRAAQAMSRVATAPDIVGGPLSRAGLVEAAEDPQRFVTVEAAPNAPLVSVTGLADNPAEAQSLVQTVVATLADRQIISGVEVVVVSAPSTPTQPTRPGWVVPLGAAAVGAMLATLSAVTVPARSRRTLTSDR